MKSPRITFSVPAITSYTSKLLHKQESIRNISLGPPATKALAPSNICKPTLQPLPKTPAQALLPCRFFSEASLRPWQGPLLRSGEGVRARSSHPTSTRRLSPFPRAPTSPSTKLPTLRVSSGGAWGTELIWRGPRDPARTRRSRRAWRWGGPGRPRHARPLPRGNRKGRPTDPQPFWTESGVRPGGPGSATSGPSPPRGGPAAGPALRPFPPLSA